MEYCGRICYNSQDKMTENSDFKFLNGLVEKGHYAVLEHAAVDVRDNMPELDKLQDDSPEFGLVMSRAVLGEVRYSDLLRFSSKYDTLEKAKELPVFDGLYSFEIHCSRNTSHQFERHRNASYCERSLRRFKWKSFDDFEAVCPFKTNTIKQMLWQRSCKESFDAYQELMKEGASPDEARSVLPSSTATVFVATMDLTWWLYFLSLRYETHASKEIQTIARQIYSQLPKEVHEAAEKTGMTEQFKKVDEVLDAE